MSCTSHDQFGIPAERSESRNPGVQALPWVPGSAFGRPGMTRAIDGNANLSPSKPGKMPYKTTAAKKSILQRKSARILPSSPPGDFEDVRNFEMRDDTVGAGSAFGE
jgi:hypothetical protein